MLRTQISLTKAERELLDAEAARTGRSVAALIRDAVDSMYGPERSIEDDLDAIQASFGGWADRGVDAAGWVDQIRSGRRLEGTS
jgi:hypothetical protein